MDESGRTNPRWRKDGRFAFSSSRTKSCGGSTSRLRLAICPRMARNPANPPVQWS